MKAKRTYLVDKSCNDMQLGKLGREPFDALGTGNEVEEEDSFLGNAALLENLHCHDRRTACVVSGITSCPFKYIYCGETYQ